MQAALKLNANLMNTCHLLIEFTPVGLETLETPCYFLKK